MHIIPSAKKVNIRYLCILKNHSTHVNHMQQININKNQKKSLPS